jgi:hypothetical protein
VTNRTSEEGLSEGFRWRRSKVVSCPRERGLACDFCSGIEAIGVIAYASEKQVAGQTKKAANPTGDVIVVDIWPRLLLEERMQTDWARRTLDLEETPVRSFRKSVLLPQLSVEARCPAAGATAEPPAIGGERAWRGAHLAPRRCADYRRAGESVQAAISTFVLLLPQRCNISNEVISPVLLEDDVAMEEIKAWLTGRLPKEWFAGAPEVRMDEDEIWVIGTLPEVQASGGGDAVKAAREGAIQRFREGTRDERIKIADEARQRFGKNLAWGAKVGDQTALFTHMAVPVMTRLRLPERELLDTLVRSGVARSRSHALAWCVRLVAKNESAWITELKEALSKVGDVRSQGPLN